MKDTSDGSVTPTESRSVINVPQSTTYCDFFAEQDNNMKTKDQYICAIVKKRPYPYARSRTAFAFSTHTQSNVENAMMAMGYCSGDYTLCYQKRLLELNELYFDKKHKTFYNINDVEIIEAGEKFGDLKWVATEMRIKLCHETPIE
jgi:hypothetical protein